jgi:uncharacterized protein (TIGR03437 family)
MNFATYFGGSRVDRVNAITVDNQGNVYLAGTTNSSDIPVTPNSYHPQFIGARFVSGTYMGQPLYDYAYDVFVTKLDAKGSLLWSTYAGGTGSDIALGIAVASSGNVYVSGSTSSADFPITSNGAWQTPSSGFLLELDATGARLLYSTYLPEAGVLAVNSAGDLYLAGSTSSAQFPVLNAVQPQLGRGDCSNSFQKAVCSDSFVMRWRTSDMKLLVSTFFGGSGPDSAAAIALDSSGNVYLAGTTASMDFPLKQPIQSTVGEGTCQSVSGQAFTRCPDAFVLKLSGDLQTVIYSTRLGGNSADSAAGIAVDPQGNIIITGTTTSLDFPTVNALQNHLAPGLCHPLNSIGTAPCSNAFVAKLNAEGTALAYSTYIGGNGGDSGNAVVVDEQGTVYIGGSTYSSNYPVTANALKHCNSRYQFAGGGGFLTGISGEGRLVFSTFFSGDLSDNVGALAAAGRQVYLAGTTASGDLPVTSGAIQSKYGGGGDGFVAVIDFGQTYTGPPRIDSDCVVNGASFQYNRVSPGEIVSIFGTGLGPETGVGAVLDAEGSISKSLGGVTVTFDGTPAPLLWVQNAQLNVIVPFGVAGQTTTDIVVTYERGASKAFQIGVAETSSGILTLDSSGGGQALAFTQDGSLNGPSNPAARGSALTFWLAGGGPLSQRFSDGQITPLIPDSLTHTPIIFFREAQAQLQYAGQAPGLVAGVIQVNVTVPAQAPTGPAIPLYLTLGSNIWSQEYPAVTVAVE